MRCSIPGCEGVPTVQWAKALDEEDTDRNIEALRSRLVDIAEAKKLDIRVQIAQLRFAHDNPPNLLSPEDTQAFQARAKVQIQGHQEDHDNVSTTFNLEHQRGVSSQALFHCQKHQFEDNPDWYAVRHNPSCGGTLECGCGVAG